MFVNYGCHDTIDWDQLLKKVREIITTAESKK